MTDSYHADRAGYAGATSHTWSHADREQISRARHAAEALFAPKRQAPEPVPSTEQTVRAPRILRASPVRKSIEPVQVPARQEAPAPLVQIPASHVARIRAWLKYGMTFAQVADLYGVVVGDVERALEELDGGRKKND
jgi:hypothetical protein